MGTDEIRKIGVSTGGGDCPGRRRRQMNLDQGNWCRSGRPILLPPVDETVQLEPMLPAIRKLLQPASLPFVNVLSPEPPLGLQGLGSLFPCHDGSSLACRVHNLRRPSVTNF